VTPHRAGDKKGLRGTFILDRKTRVGRIAVASGTKHAPTFRRLNEMITSLGETGRSDLLREIRDGHLKPLAVYEAFRVNELHRLPTGSDLKPLKEALDAWLETVDCSKAQKAAHKTMINKMTERGKGTVADLPGRLVLVGLDCRKARTPAQFNRVRASVLAFIRDTLKRSHRLYGEIRDIPIMKEKKSPERHVLSWTEVQSIAEKMIDARDRAAVYGMALTGMGPKEWYIDGWKLGLVCITIYGAKRKSRTRVVPAVYGGGYFSHPLPDCDVGREREKRRFGERLLDRVSIRPYDLRRTYANWLEAAGIPRTRRKAYLGHAGGDVTSIYEHHEVEQFLADDATKIEAYLAQAPITLHITKTGESNR
jgi:integrase